MSAYVTAIQQVDNYPAMIEVKGIHQAQKCMASRYCDHNLSSINSDLRLRFRELEFNRLSIDQLEHDGDVTVEIEDTGDFFIVALPMAGEVTIDHCDTSLVASSSQAMILSPSKPIEMKFSEQFKGRLVKIRRAAVEQQLATILGRAVTRSVIFDVGMDIDNENGAGASWLRTVSMLEQEHGFSQSLYKGPCLNQIVDMLISGLLYGQRHNYSDDMQARGNSIAPAHVRRAERYIQANVQSCMTIENIVEASGVPRRTLYDGFKRFRGTSPMNFLRTIRMEGAHEDIINTDYNENITYIAMKWGFSHLGRFSIDYKKRYGSSPSQMAKGFLAKTA